MNQALYAAKKNQLKKHGIRNIGLLIVSGIMICSCNSQPESVSQKEQMPLNLPGYSGELTDGIVYFSDDGGLTWKDKSNGLPDKVTLGIGGLAVSDNSLGIATKDDGIYLFESQSRIWVHIPTAEEIIVNNLGALAFFKNQIYVGTQFNGVYTSSKDGNNWKNLKEGLGNLTIRKLVPLGDKLYAGTNAGLYLLDNKLNNWKLEFGSSNLQVNGITGFDGNIYIATNQGIYTDANEQGEWKKILDGYSIHNISADDEYIYAMTYNELFSSKDYGNSWTSIQKGLPRELYTFDIIKNKNLVFAGQWDGVYRKNSKYDNWQSFSNGLPNNLAITNIKPYLNYIVVSGNNRGLRNGMTTDK